MPLSVEIALLYESFPAAADVWDVVASTHPEFDEAEVVDGLEDKKLIYGSVGNYLRKTNADGLLIEMGEASIEHGNITDLELSRLDLIRLVRDPEDTERWLAKLLKDERMVQARLYDFEYDHWQNAEDLAVYAAAGRSTAGLPMKSNGYPFPLTQQIVDTDANPGRLRLRRGWIESVGATMWLGPQFWKISGANRAALQSCDGVVMTDVSNGVTKVTTAYDVFRTASGSEGELQKRMRAALYGT